MQILWVSVYTTHLPWKTTVAESLSDFPILPWGFYQHNRADVLGITEYHLQMGAEVWYPTRALA